jgi:hypothetical protein
MFFDVQTSISGSSEYDIVFKNSTILLNMAPYSLKVVYWLYEAIYWLHLQCVRVGFLFTCCLLHIDAEVGCSTFLKKRR